jgi:dATP pyrophosphohydrolase
MITQTVSYKRPESVLVVVYSACAKVLLLQRRDDNAFWQSITGSLMLNELPLDAAWRELKEETGLNEINGQLHDCHQQQWFDIYPHWRYRYEPGVTRNLEHVFSFEVKEPLTIRLSHEHLDYCWLTKEAAMEKVISTTNRDAISQFVKFTANDF